MVSVGNPFVLLKIEQHMVRKYGEKGRCWSEYLRACLENNTLTIHPSLRISVSDQQRCISKLRGLVGRQSARAPEVAQPKVEEKKEGKTSMAGGEKVAGGGAQHSKLPSDTRVSAAQAVQQPVKLTSERESI